MKEESQVFDLFFRFKAFVENHSNPRLKFSEVMERVGTLPIFFKKISIIMELCIGFLVHVPLSKMGLLNGNTRM